MLDECVFGEGAGGGGCLQRRSLHATLLGVSRALRFVCWWLGEVADCGKARQG